MRLPSPALAIASLALFVALGGTVYAAKKAKIDGKAVKVKSLPGNRVKLRSIPANRLKPDVLPGRCRSRRGRSPGRKSTSSALGQVPNAAHAETADQRPERGRCADGPQCRQRRQRADGQRPQRRLPAGNPAFRRRLLAELSSETAVSAPAAATSCAVQGGALPEALQLAAFSQQPGVVLDKDNEWSRDLTNMTGPNDIRSSNCFSSWGR